MVSVGIDPVTPGTGIPGPPQAHTADAAVRVGPASFVTLDYRLAAIVNGAEREVFTTFGARPVTLQIGAGQLAPALEDRLIGLLEGTAAQFELAPGDGFGNRSPDLVQALSVAAAEIDPDEFEPGDVVEVNAPDGRRVAGVVKQLDVSRVVLDFNHPLAGLPLRFDVRVIGVL
jgi:FKBP-type peptidyl-prolyl cis-trans isomerase SlpA